MYEGEDRGKWMSEEHLGAEAKGGAVWGSWLGAVLRSLKYLIHIEQSTDTAQEKSRAN